MNDKQQSLTGHYDPYERGRHVQPFEQATRIDINTELNIIDARASRLDAAAQESYSELQALHGKQVFELIDEQVRTHDARIEKIAIKLIRTEELNMLESPRLRADRAKEQATKQVAIMELQEQRDLLARQVAQCKGFVEYAEEQMKRKAEKSLGKTFSKQNSGNTKEEGRTL